MSLPHQGMYNSICRHFSLSQLGQRGLATGIQWIEAREGAKLPTMNRTALHNTELSSANQQQYRAQKNPHLKHKPSISASAESTPFNAVTSRVRNETKKHVTKLIMYFVYTLRATDIEFSVHDNDSICLAIQKAYKHLKQIRGCITAFVLVFLHVIRYPPTGHRLKRQSSLSGTLECRSFQKQILDKSDAKSLQQKFS